MEGILFFGGCGFKLHFAVQMSYRTGLVEVEKDVGFRSSTQPTNILFFQSNKRELMRSPPRFFAIIPE